MSDQYCCKRFNLIFDNNTILPIFSEYEDDEPIMTRLGVELRLPKISGFSLPVVEKYDFHRGYGETMEISYCPFCGKNLSPDSWCNGSTSPCHGGS